MSRAHLRAILVSACFVVACSNSGGGAANTRQDAGIEAAPVPADLAPSLEVPGQAPDGPSQADLTTARDAAADTSPRDSSTTDTSPQDSFVADAVAVEAAADANPRDGSAPDGVTLDTGRPDAPPSTDTSRVPDAPVAADAIDAPRSADTSTDGPGSSTEAGPSSGKWLMGYYPMYQVTDGTLPVADVPYALMTHLAVGAAIPGNDGSVDFDPYGATVTVIDDIVRRAHAAGSKAILMVGGAGDSVHTGFVNSSAAARRPTLVNNLVTWAKAHGFDGLDLDWEPLDTADRPNFLALAQDIRAAWSAAVLTVPIGYLNINIDRPDAWYGGLAAVFDQINIMSYGMAGPYGGWMSWHSSALQGEKGNTPTSIDSTVKAYTAAAVGIPPAKLGVGSGFYGICYGSPVTAPNQTPGTAFSADDNTNAYNVIVTLGGTRSWDSTALVPYLTFSTPAGANKCTYISYEDPQSLTEKANYVKSKGLGGVIVWTIAEGHLKTAARPDPLLDALSAGLR